MNVTLHAAPILRTVLREQVRIVARSLIREARAFAAVLAIVAVVIGVEIFYGRAALWFDSDDWAAIGLVALVFPFSVWRRDRLFMPAFLWTLPVNRAQLLYAKVFAGWVWLMVAFIVFVAFQFALSLLSGLASPQIISFDAGIGITALYLLGSGILLGLRHPLRWFLGAAGVLIMLGLLERGLASGPWAFEIFFETPQLKSAVERFTSAWQRLPRFAQSLIPNLLMLVVGFLTVRTAASRHADNRRR